MNRLGKSSWKSGETWALILAGFMESLQAAGVFHQDSVGAHVIAGLAALFAVLRTGLKASEAKSIAEMVSKKKS